MTFVKQAVLFLALVSLSVIAWLVSSQQSIPDPTKANPVLKEALLACDGITERAAAHLVAIVEFQKLEIAGRKAAVFKQCMQDRGYHESPKWLAYSIPLSTKIAAEAPISSNEALERLRRTDMVQSSNVPSYWILKSAIR